MRIETIFIGSPNTCYTPAIQNAHMKTSQLRILRVFERGLER